MSDDEAVEIENLPAVRQGQPPATLFRTDDPREIVARATEVAEALSQVLSKQGLTSRINDREYVRVEGWSLCGSMLGVFPVVEWTRKLEDGWEARVEARTKEGMVVGAAEAQCLRSESKWRSRDDYAIRSMAQTRAVSKALRGPLGFVVTLAGYEATPAEEMGTEAPREFDPETDLMEGAIRGKDAPKRLVEAMEALDPTVDWPIAISLAVALKWGVSDWRELGDHTQEFWRRLSNAVEWMTQAAPPGTMPPITDEQIVAGFAYAFSGVAMEEVPRVPPDPVDEDVQSIPFGEEAE